MQNIFIGIDGGATKSKVRIENETGHLLGQSTGGPANIRLSVEGSWAAIYQVIEDALRPAGIKLLDKNYDFHLGLGLAGCEVIDAKKDFLACEHPFKTLRLASDAYVACLGAHKGRDGAIIIVGTGVIGYQIQQGKSTQVGGWGFPHDDEGSGAWLGLEAARLTFQMLDHRTEKSPLAEDVYAFFNHNLDQFTTWANRANSSEFARLAPLVINHAQQEEIAAVRLMKKAAHAVDRVAAALLKTQQQRENPLPCSLFGGIAPFLEAWLGEELRERIVPRQGDANTGALILIREGVTA